MSADHKRLPNFLHALDRLISEFEFYDYEKDEDVCEITEEEAYNAIMKNDEWHLIGSESVKQYIHIFITDPRTRFELLHN